MAALPLLVDFRQDHSGHGAMYSVPYLTLLTCKARSGSDHVEGYAKIPKVLCTLYLNLICTLHSNHITTIQNEAATKSDLRTRTSNMQSLNPILGR